ncbi:M20 metallopeptidase family protein [Streptosporangium carneum]|uniref:N-acyl-L-amino acid amidohydrolase n=1 Tax=Streptosporangium carneum TaxID=47481 RepID=A0A9W6I736_9ACTN|nr:amidohydrolase [Streptosporangium carneum]GLK13276.1 N-acyl-L-amino acid amidohydrolase [Streptosporangium carneum]
MNDVHERLRAALATELPGACELRRELHAEPYVSGSEEPTLKRVLDALPGGGAPERVAETGALVRVGGEGLAVGVRGELDALPITEETGVPWAARNGAMHACGHDVHLAALVALARAVDRVNADDTAHRTGAPEGSGVGASTWSPRETERGSAGDTRRETLGGGLPPLVAVLQPREETYPSGALDIVESGALERHRIGAMVAAHVQPVLAAGETACTPGAVNASADEFTLIVRGQGGHAAYPQLSRDPVLALAQIIVAAQQLVSRDADPMTPTVVTFGTVNAGTAPNATPADAVARGTLRTMSEAWREQLHERFRVIADGVARAHGCEAEVLIVRGEPVLVNDARLAEETARLLALSPDAAVRHVPATLRSCGADDFAYFCSAVPSLMLFVGTDTASGLHTPEFLPGEETVAAVAESLLAAYLAAARVIGAVDV